MKMHRNWATLNSPVLCILISFGYNLLEEEEKLNKIISDNF